MIQEFNVPWNITGVVRPPFAFTGNICVQESNLSKDNIRGIFESFFLQGVCSKPESKMYFLKWESIETPLVSRMMSEQRFHLLQKFLHFANNEEFNGATMNKKLFQIQPVLNYLKEKYMSLYIFQEKCR